MDYRDIAKEILDDKELKEKYKLSDEVIITDSHILVTVLRKIAEEKANHRSEQKTNTAKITRELNKLFSIN